MFYFCFVSFSCSRRFLFETKFHIYEAIGHVTSNQEQSYDPTLGIVLNIDKLDRGDLDDRDTGENKYKRRPLLEWLSRFLRYIFTQYTYYFYKIFQQQKKNYQNLGINVHFNPTFKKIYCIINNSLYVSTFCYDKRFTFVTFF